METDWHKLKIELLLDGFHVVTKQNPLTLNEENCLCKGNCYLFYNMLAGIEDVYRGAPYFKSLQLMRSSDEVKKFFGMTEKT